MRARRCLWSLPEWVTAIYDEPGGGQVADGAGFVYLAHVDGIGHDYRTHDEEHLRARGRSGNDRNRKEGTEMRRVIGLIATATLWLAAGWASGNSAQPDIVLHQADGDAVFKLSDAKGKYVALHFLLKTTCPYCIRHTHGVWQRAGELPDVAQVFIKPDTEEEIRQWSVRLSGKFDEDQADNLPVIYRDPDAALAKRLEIPFGYEFHGQTVHYPALVLMGPDGREVFRYVGKKNSDRYSFDQLKEKVAELRGETGIGDR